MRKHPVALGLAILVGLGVFFFAFVYSVSRWSGEKGSFDFSGKVGVVRIEGIIGGISEITDQIDEFSDDDSVQAVVLRIDSPGGGVAPSQEIYQAVQQLRKKKKVVASMGSVAASGGYLVATAAERIVANPGTITGSISAVMHFADVQELMKKVGVRSSVVKSGKFKDIGSPTREMTDEERQLIQGVVDDIYDQFVRTVSENRKMPLSVIQGLADGRIFTGRQAHQLKLVDELGGLQDAVLLAGRLAGIQGKPQVVYAVEKKASLWKYLLENMASAVAGEIRKTSTEWEGGQFLFR
jgi:protease-4